MCTFCIRNVYIYIYVSVRSLCALIIYDLNCIPFWANAQHDILKWHKKWLFNNEENNYFGYLATVNHNQHISIRKCGCAIDSLWSRIKWWISMIYESGGRWNEGKEGKRDVDRSRWKRSKCTNLLKWRTTTTLMFVYPNKLENQHPAHGSSWVWGMRRWLSICWVECIYIFVSMRSFLFTNRFWNDWRNQSMCRCLCAIAIMFENSATTPHIYIHLMWK